MIAREARKLLRAHRYGALCTLSRKFDGYPFGSITPYLVDHDGSLHLLISTLAEQTKNILHDPPRQPYHPRPARPAYPGTGACDRNRQG